MPELSACITVSIPKNIELYRSVGKYLRIIPVALLIPQWDRADDPVAFFGEVNLAGKTGVWCSIVALFEKIQFLPVHGVHLIYVFIGEKAPAFGTAWANSIVIRISSSTLTWSMNIDVVLASNL
mmetsp:Transcript_17101/g.27179  ORF Transcript_17101/g.27179 Transcript_17101/m.27179 type:complete len:124 (+) Transcript_17101:154-525(+)